MKKILFPLILVVFSAQFSTAQEEGVLLVKSAGTALASYHSDPVNNSAKLAEAINLIEQSLENPEVQTMVSAWLTKGDIYYTRLQSDWLKRQKDPNTPLTGDNDALVVFKAYIKVYSLSQLPNEKSDAIKGISEVQGQLVNIGVSKYEEMEYEKSFLSFQASLESHELLKDNGQTSLLDDPQQLEDQVYMTALAASMANRCPDAIVFYDKLYDAGTDRPAVYQGFYHCKQASGDEAGAGRILSEGRQKFPNDTSLLFAEINLFLKDGKLNEMVGPLEQAIELEPNNVSLYVTLGNVYDNLYQSASQNNDVPNENVYFEQAKKYYSKGLLIDPQNLEANYSLGSLYYNKAAIRTQQMNRLPEDFSTKGIENLNFSGTRSWIFLINHYPILKRQSALFPMTSIH